MIEKYKFGPDFYSTVTGSQFVRKDLGLDKAAEKWAKKVKKGRKRLNKSHIIQHKHVRQTLQKGGKFFFGGKL
jgi:hypothetical protein